MKEVLYPIFKGPSSMLFNQGFSLKPSYLAQRNFYQDLKNFTLPCSKVAKIIQFIFCITIDGSISKVQANVKDSK
jgi:hypothetical protein